MANQDGAKKRLLSDTLLIFLIPVYAYLLIYTYEYGYFFRLAIPADFIEINLVSLAPLSIFLVLYFFFIVGVLDLIYKLVVHGKDVAISTLIQLYFLIVCVVLPSIALGRTKIFLPVAAVGFGLLLISRFVLPILSQKGIKGYWNKAEQEYKKEIEPSSNGILAEFARRFGLTTFRILLFLITFLLVSFFIGAISAKTQKAFLIINTNPEQVILRKHQNTFLCIEFNRDKRELIYKFQLISIDQVSQKGYTITQEKVGPLSKPINFQKN
jgi:hypothetical protein